MEKNWGDTPSATLIRGQLNLFLLGRLGSRHYVYKLSLYEGTRNLITIQCIYVSSTYVINYIHFFYIADRLCKTLSTTEEKRSRLVH